MDQMTDYDQTVEQAKYDTNAMSPEERDWHDRAMEHFDMARELFAEAEKYKRSASYLFRDNFQNDDFLKAYANVYNALQDLGRSHRFAGDNFVHRLAQKNLAAMERRRAAHIKEEGDMARAAEDRRQTKFDEAFAEKTD